MEILKNYGNFFAEQIRLQSNAISASKFLASFKFAKIKSVFKIGARNQRDSYRPISILPIFAKIFEIDP